MLNERVPVLWNKDEQQLLDLPSVHEAEAVFK